MINQSLLRVCCALLISAGSILSAEEMIISRATVENFITDPIVLKNIHQSDDTTKTMPSTFIMTHPITGQQVYWSPVVCRMIGIKNGTRTSSFHEMIAEGPHPLAFSLGAIGKPRYFGFRLVNGLPEFLYTYGQLSIEERYRFSPDGRQLLQSFKVASNAIDGAYSLSEKLRPIVTANNGKWGNNVLMLKREELNEGFTVTFHLDPAQFPTPE